MVRPASNARSIPCWQSPRFARESGRSLFPTEHRRFKRGAVSIGAPFRRVETSHNGCSENFLGDGRIFWGDGRGFSGGTAQEFKRFGRKPAAFTTNPAAREPASSFQPGGDPRQIPFSAGDPSGSAIVDTAFA